MRIFKYLKKTKYINIHTHNAPQNSLMFDFNDKLSSKDVAEHGWSCYILSKNILYFNIFIYNNKLGPAVG